MALALSIDSETGRMRVRLETLSAWCGGYSHRTVLRGLNELVGHGIIERQRTGRSAIYTALAGVESGRVEVTPVTHQTCHPCHINPRKPRKRYERNPDDPSPFGRTAEEREKAGIWQAVLERERKGAKAAPTTATTDAPSQQGQGRKPRARHNLHGPSGPLKSDDSTGNAGATRTLAKCGEAYDHDPPDHPPA